MKERVFTLESDLHLKKGAEEFLSAKKAQLLENISIYGSISKAAKASDITYKTAWAWIDRMNAAASKPLVQKISGGTGGGGTIITAAAKELLCRFEEIEALHAKHLASLQDSFESLEDEGSVDFSFSRLEGEIVGISQGEKRATLRLRLSCGDELNAQVPLAFLRVHRLGCSSHVSILIEAEAVSVARMSEGQISSRNTLQTQVKDVMLQADGVVLKLLLESGEYLTSLITRQSYENLRIQKEDRLLAIFKAYSITLLAKGE